MLYALVLVLLCLPVSVFAHSPKTPDARAEKHVHATVRVQVHTAGENPAQPAAVKDAYIALVPSHQPFHRPLMETVAATGATDFEVNAGQYFLIVAAEGFQTELRTVHTFKGGNSVNVQLAPATVVSGTVKSPDGKPIPRARIRHVSVAAPLARGELSEVARKKLAAGRQVETDARGAWRLPLVGHQDMLLVEAPGRAPAWIAYDPSQHQKNPIQIVLQKGAALEVALDRTDADLLISVVPKADGVAIPPVWRSRVWARPASGETIQWESLPPGDYSIVAEHPDPLRFLRQVELGHVSLRAGSTANAKISLPAEIPPPARDYVHLMAADRTDLEDVRTFARRTGGGIEVVPSSVEQVSGGSVIYVKTAGTPADVHVTTGTYLIAAVPRGYADSSHELPADTLVFHRAFGKLRVGAREGLTLPRSANAKYSRCAGTDLTVILPFDIEKDGAVALPLLVSCSSLTLAFDGFAPLAFTPAARSGDEKWLGEHLLDAPAVAEIRVVQDPGRLPVKNAMVRALVKPDRHQAVMLVEARADETGKIVLKNLPAGQDVTFEARDGVTERVGSETRRIAPGERLVLDPLAIPAPASLTVVPRFAAAFAADNPDATIEAVVLTRRGGTRDDRRDASLRSTDAAVFHDIPAGIWQVIAVVQVEELTQPVEIETIELESGEQKRLESEIRPLVFTGQVLANGKGVQASLGIGDPPGPNAIRRRVVTKEDGTFTVTLPRGGLYRVDVRRNMPFALPGARQAASSERPIDLGPIRFDPSSPFVQIDLPTGTISVRVRSGEQAVAEADVVATMRSENAAGTSAAPVMRRIRTDSAGEATLVDLPEGTWTVEARDLKSGRSAAKSARVSRSGGSQVALNIEPGGVLEGRIVDSNGASVAGARVDCMYVAAGEIPREVTAETKLDGRFSIELTKDAPPVLYCGVATSTGAVEAFAARPNEQATITLSSAPASLTITDWGNAISANRFWLVSNDGRLLNLTWASRKFGRPWSALDISRLPSGQWKVVRIDAAPAWVALGQGVGASLPSLASIRLTAGEHQEIKIHEPMTR